MSEHNPNNDPRLPSHTHSRPENLDATNEQGAEIIDLISILQRKEETLSPTVDDMYCTEVRLDPINETEDRSISESLNEKRLESILAVAIGSVLFGAIYPAANNIENQKVQEATVTGLASLLGWSIFYVSIPYIQESKLGKLFTKKDKNTEKS